MADQPTHSPLGVPRHVITDKQREQLSQLEHEIKFWQAEIAKAKKIGIDVRQLESQMKQVEQIRNLLLENYG